MWKCPNCNTTNKSNFCKICNTEKPLNQNNDSLYVCKSIHQTSQRPIIVITIILAILLLIASTVLITLLLTKRNVPTTEKFVQTETKSEEQNKSLIPKYKPPKSLEVPKEPEQEKPSELSEITYLIYENDHYGFYCAYPENFIPFTPDNINALIGFTSPDNSAKITIRAAQNNNDISIEQAVQDFQYEYSGETAYFDSGETWYAISVIDNDIIYYRKFFIAKDNMYCFDFEYEAKDSNIYNQCITHIEKNFKVF